MSYGVLRNGMNAETTQNHRINMIYFLIERELYDRVPRQRDWAILILTMKPTRMCNEAPWCVFLPPGGGQIQKGGSSFLSIPTRQPPTTLWTALYSSPPCCEGLPSFGRPSLRFGIQNAKREAESAVQYSYAWCVLGLPQGLSMTALARGRFQKSRRKHTPPFLPGRVGGVPAGRREP